MSLKKKKKKERKKMTRHLKKPKENQTKNKNIKVKRNAKHATMSFLVEVIPPLVWVILQEKF